MPAPRGTCYIWHNPTPNPNTWLRTERAASRRLGTCFVTSRTLFVTIILVHLGAVRHVGICTCIEGWCAIVRAQLNAAQVTSWWKGAPAPAPAPTAPAQEFNPSDPKQNPLNPQGLKPCVAQSLSEVCYFLLTRHAHRCRCCACPETKSARDDCFLKHGEEATERCKWLVKSHIECMRSYGFKV